MKKAIFYHAGCPVCVSAEQDILNLIPRDQVTVVHLGSEKLKVQEAEAAGVRSVPALVWPMAMYCISILALL
ncbi:thioredoxin family protein [Terrimonas rubra]|uniref:Thioredoxin family protein n=1 Tax=Terrimonas rubra TaxID=1035890 RepID=A0ABW6ABN5_9BACT